MIPNKKIGVVLLVISGVLLCVQFILIFTTKILPTDARNSTLILHLTPYAVFLVSLYLIFSKAALPTDLNRVVRAVIVLAASSGIAEGVFLIVLMVDLAWLGPEAVSDLFSYFPALLGLGTLLALPLVNRFLR